MVRYIRKDELHHSGTKGMKWGQRLYQYKDGTYTPLGRIHYGIGINKKELTGAERIAETVKAVRDTAAGYGLVKYKEHKKVIKGNKRHIKADQRRAEKAYAMRQEIKAKAKAEKEKAKALYAEKKAENERKLKEQQEARAKKRAEEAEQKALFKLEKEKQKEENKNEKQSEKNMNKAKTDRFENFSDDELRRYTERVKLEQEANEARVTSMLQRLGAPARIVETLASYGNAGLQAYNAYTNFSDALKRHKDENVPKIDSPIQATAKDLMNDFMKLYSTGALKDPITSSEYRAELSQVTSTLEAAAKVFEMAEGRYRPKQ